MLNIRKMNNAKISKKLGWLRNRTSNRIKLERKRKNNEGIKKKRKGKNKND